MPRIDVVSNAEAVLRGASPQVVRKVDLALSFEYPNVEHLPHVKRFVKHLIDVRGLKQRAALEVARSTVGRKRLFSAATGKFPVGLLSRVQKLVPLAEVRDRRGRDDFAPPATSSIRRDMLPGISLYDHQIKAAKVAISRRRGILHLATNAGKTNVAAAVVKALGPAATVLFLVHKKVLLRQARQALARGLGVVEDAIGEVGDGRRHVARVTVGIVNSVVAYARRPEGWEWLSSVDALFLDECHHARAKTFFDVAKMCGGASFRIGLTGSPGETDVDLLLVEAATGPVIARVTNDELIEVGVSARPTVEIVSYRAPNLDGEWEWGRVYEEGVVGNSARNVEVVNAAAAAAKEGKQVLVLVRRISHGKLVASMLKVLGVTHRFAWSKMTSDELDEVKRAFEAREFSVLVGSPIYDEGVDLPGIEVLVVADGGRSLRATLQKVGRALRRKKRGPNEVRIVDFADDCHPMLSRHAARRIEIYEAEKFEVVAK